MHDEPIIHPGYYSRWECERRFLCDARPPEFMPEEEFDVLDRYLDDTRLRARRMTNRATGEVVCVLGQKLESRARDLAQLEVTNMYVSASELELLRTLPGRDLAKVRNRGWLDGLWASIDAFADHDLLVLTIDFDSVEAMQAWQPPASVGREVTQDIAYSGGALAEMSAEG